MSWGACLRAWMVPWFPDRWVRNTTKCVSGVALSTFQNPVKCHLSGGPGGLVSYNQRSLHIYLLHVGRTATTVKRINMAENHCQFCVAG
jgi:hypothetical protein